MSGTKNANSMSFSLMKWLSRINRKQKTILAIFALSWFMLNQMTYEPPLNYGLVLLTATALLWITEAVHITITALLIPVLIVIFGLFDAQTALQHFSHPIIFLFLGSFVIAASLQSQNIDKMIADKLMRFSGGRFDKAAVLLFLMTAFISMWVSNTIATAIMLPFGLSLLTEVNDKKYRNTYVFVLLGICYSASIGGIATILGSPVNILAAAQGQVGFKEWMEFGFTAMMILLPLMLIVLYLVLKPNMSFKYKIPKSNTHIPPSGKLTLLIFAATVICLIQSYSIGSYFGQPKNFESIIVLMSVFVLAFFRLVTWKDIQQIADWGVIILFGGGLSLSYALNYSGTSAFLAHELMLIVGGDSISTLVMVMIFCVLLFTQIGSNTTMTVLLLPVLIGVAQESGLSPLMVTALIGMAANCAFMLPVSTPPNAIVFGTGYVKQVTMIKVGLLLCFIASIVIYLMMTTFWIVG